VLVPRWSYIAGFGKGAFKHLKAQEALNEAMELEFKLTDYTDMVVIANAVQSLGILHGAPFKMGSSS